MNTRLLPGILLLFLLPLDANAQEWSRLRGPAGQGHGEADLPTVFGEQDIRWRVDIGGTGHSSPVLWADHLFLTRVRDADKQSEGAGEREVVCYDAGSGEQLWAAKCEFETYKQHKLNSFASSTPVADERGVYVLWTSGAKLIALALDHEGKQMWAKELGGFQGEHGSANSPVLHGELLVIANENEGEDCFLTALDRATGETRWRIERQQGARWACYSPPFVYQPKHGDAMLLLASFAHGLTALEPASGKVKWQANPGFKYRFIATPSICGDLLLVNTGAGDSGKECVVFEFGENAAVEPTVKYRPRRGLPYVPAAIALDGKYFLFGDSGFVSCLEASSGDELWRERIDSQFFSSPVSNGKAIYIADREGRLLTFSTSKFEVLGSFDVGSPVFATPALALGCLFLRTADQLMCLSRRKAD